MRGGRQRGMGEEEVRKLSRQEERGGFRPGRGRREESQEVERQLTTFAEPLLSSRPSAGGSRHGRF